MKKILIFILLTTSCFGGWDVTKPSSSTSLRNSNPEILANWVALQVALSQDHTFATGTPDGKHTQITFTAPLGSPPGTVVETEGVLYLLDVGGTSELHFEDEDENTIQMTSAGNLFSSTGLTVTNNATFNGGITLGAGDDLIGSSTSDINFGSGKFTVSGSTGSVHVDGNFACDGSIDPTTYSTGRGGFLDQDNMSSDSANKVASQQSIKAYVDAVDSADDFSPTSYAGGESITFPNGLIIKRGTKATVSPSGDTVVTFAVAFPNALKTVTISMGGSTDHGSPLQVKSKHATDSFVIDNPNGGGAPSAEWMAIGY